MIFPSLPGRSLAGEDVDVSQLIGGRVSLVILAFRAMGTVSSPCLAGYCSLAATPPFLDDVQVVP